MRIRVNVIVNVIVLALAACNAVGPPPEPAPGCNPLIGDDCVTPFPSSFFERSDSTSATGFRVAISDHVMPSSSRGVPLRLDRFNAKDGFSPATPFLVYFKNGVDATQLPAQTDLASSATAQSTVQIIDFSTRERIPLFAELDANALPGDRKALIIHPATRLKPGTRYVVALVDLHDASGLSFTPAPFAALRDHGDLSVALTAVQPRIEEDLDLLDAVGVARATVTLAWDVVTASDETATGHLLAMRDLAVAQADAGKLGYAILSSTTPNDPHLLREIIGTVTVPSFLAGDDPAATMNFGPDGQPAVRAPSTAKLVIHVPQCANTANAPLPVLVFGHGLFGDAQTELSTDYEKQLADRLCMVQIATDWIGLSSSDVPTITSKVLADLNNIYIITDRLQQAHVNAQVMARLFLSSIKDDPALALNGKPVTDGSQIYYYGISDGGIQGGTFMALSEDVARGVLNVPGCEWSLMAFRSHDFASLASLLNGIYPDPLDQQVLFAASQSEWDYTDPATWAPHVLYAPLPKTPPKRILVQEAIDDAQVPNVATRVLVRALGVPGLDLGEHVFGVVEKAAPLDSAYTQWNVHPMPPPPDGDVPPPSDNPAHECIRRLDLLQKQLQLFFSPTGAVEETCNGPCDFTSPPECAGL